MKAKLTLVLALTALILSTGSLLAGNNTKTDQAKSTRVECCPPNEKEMDVQLESWMNQRFDLSASFTSEITDRVVEGWMTDPRVFLGDTVAANEPAVELENWMTSGNFEPSICTATICESEPRLESWMLNF
jgi:hypothetical protein